MLRENLFRVKESDLPEFRPESRFTEKNLQAELYHRLRRFKIDIILEYSSFNSRYDAVIVKNNKLIAIIEVKSNEKVSDKQKEKYENNPWNLPVLYLLNWTELTSMIRQIRQLYKNS